MMIMDGELKFLRRDLVLVKIKTYMLLTGATISNNCTALFCLWLHSGGEVDALQAVDRNLECTTNTKTCSQHQMPQPLRYPS